MRLYKQRRRPYTHIIPKPEILNVINNVASEGGAVCSAFTFKQIKDTVSQEEYESFYAIMIEKAFDVVSRAIYDEYGIDVEYINIDKILDDNGDEAFILYRTAKELRVTIKEKDNE